MAKRTSPTLSSWAVKRALDEIQAAREALLAIEPDMPDADRQLYLDTLEGGTDVFETLDRIVRAAVDAGDMAEAAGKRARLIAERKARFERRENALRLTAKALLEAISVNRLDRDDYTVSIGKGREHVVVTDADGLDEKYVRIIREPKKAELLADLKAGEQPKGAELSNPGTILRITT